MGGESCMKKTGGRMTIAKLGKKPWIVPKKEPEMCEKMASAY
jgi:uncharacterized Fe-S cluster protein YjdI